MSINVCFSVCTSTLYAPFYTDYERISISVTMYYKVHNNIRPMTKEQEQKLNLK